MSTNGPLIAGRIVMYNRGRNKPLRPATITHVIDPEIGIVGLCVHWHPKDTQTHVVDAVHYAKPDPDLEMPVDSWCWPQEAPTTEQLTMKQRQQRDAARERSIRYHQEVEARRKARLAAHALAASPEALAQAKAKIAESKAEADKADPPPAEPEEAQTDPGPIAEAGDGDDLTQLPGIGKAKAAKLAEAGFSSFDAIAAAEPEAIAAAADVSDETASAIIDEAELLAGE